MGLWAHVTEIWWALFAMNGSTFFNCNFVNAYMMQQNNSRSRAYACFNRAIINKVYLLLAVRLLANASWPRLWLSTYTLIYIYTDEASTTHTSNFQPIACDRWPPYVLLSDMSASSLRAVRFWPVLRTGYCREGPFLSGCVFWRLLSRPC